TGETASAVGLKECVRRAAESLEKERKPTASGKRCGWGIACMWKFSVPTAHVMSTIKINADGSAILNTSAVEHGQGAHTILRQIAAEALGLDPSLISVSQQDTSTSPYGWETSSSKTTFFDGNAIRLAAEDAKAHLFRAAAVLLEADPEDLETADGRIFPRGAPDRFVTFSDVAMGVFKPDGGFVGGPVLGRGHYSPLPASPTSEESGMGRKPASFWMYAAQGAEVEVDVETGEVHLLKLTAAHDVGKAINPNGCTGQIEGALAQGLGTALFEEMHLEEGQVLNPTFMDYKIPCAVDMPSLVPMLVEEHHPEGPYGAKGVGEPGLAPTAAAIANAIYDAIGVQIKSLPITPERILEAIRESASG
ncbi:MAG: molybdopterin cofactor-binding domain-containing protein, partial [bacterium]